MQRVYDGFEDQRVSCIFIKERCQRPAGTRATFQRGTEKTCAKSGDC